MRLYLSKLVTLLVVVFFNSVYAQSFNTSYEVSSSGIKMGNFNWSLEIDTEKYETKIYLKNSGIFSPLYKFEGKYESSGVIEGGLLQSRNYKQFWKTRKKTKIVEMTFNNYLTNLFQEPYEAERPRIKLNELYKYCDPVTSFINILNGSKEAKTVDGRRIYIMKSAEIKNKTNITIEIKDYQNIWADHSRNDLKKIEFFLSAEEFLPKKIKIYFKNRVFNLKKN